MENEYQLICQSLLLYLFSSISRAAVITCCVTYYISADKNDMASLAKCSLRARSNSYIYFLLPFTYPLSIIFSLYDYHLSYHPIHLFPCAFLDALSSFVDLTFFIKLTMVCIAATSFLPRWLLVIANGVYHALADTRKVFVLQYCPPDYLYGVAVRDTVHLSLYPFLSIAFVFVISMLF
jgi:hypothetical protein